LAALSEYAPILRFPVRNRIFSFFPLSVLETPILTEMPVDSWFLSPADSDARTICHQLSSIPSVALCLYLEQSPTIPFVLEISAIIFTEKLFATFNT
jgi:hypothetical protein